jgi:predicted RNA-binding Zn-ribbon protein involved in translation (DUF1610 family)
VSTRTQRFAKELGVLLLLSVFINITLAWCCALFVPVPTHDANPLAGVLKTSDVDAILRSRVPLRSAEWTSRSGHEFSAFGRTFRDAWITQQDFGPGEGEVRASRMMVQIWSDGWPFRSMFGEQQSDLTRPVRFQSRGLWRIQWLKERFRHAHSDGLPLYPIWDGFALNTVIFVMILWSLTTLRFIPRWLRSRRLAAKGRCKGCGYDLSGAKHLRCPECGNVIKPQRVADAASSAP